MRHFAVGVILAAWAVESSAAFLQPLSPQLLSPQLPSPFGTCPLGSQQGSESNGLQILGNQRPRGCLAPIKWRMQDGGNKEKGFSSSSVLSIFCPLLKLIANPDPTEPRNKALETATSGFASIARLPWGSEVAPEVAGSLEGRPSQPIKIYEFEACPFCRRVREVVTYLDLEVEIRPCPKDSIRHREIVKASGGKLTFPYMEDPNTGTAMYESADIVNYLVKTYGNGAEVPKYLLESTLFTGWMPTLLRAGRGMSRFEGAAEEIPAQPLVLYNYENNQFCRFVREALCELEIPHIVKSAGKGSPRRAELLETSGATRCPYLLDPNTGKGITDSGDIMEYLFSTYTVAR